MLTMSGQINRERRINNKKEREIQRLIERIIMKTKIAENKQEEIRLLRQEKKQILAGIMAYEIENLQKRKEEKQQMEEEEEKRREEDKIQKEELKKLNETNYKLGNMLKELFQEKHAKQKEEINSKRKLPKLTRIKAEESKISYIKQERISGKGQEGGYVATEMMETSNRTSNI